MTHDTSSGRFQYLMTSINLDLEGFVPSDTVRTYVHLNANPESVVDTGEKVDLCCPAHDWKFNVTDWINT